MGNQRSFVLNSVQYPDEKRVHILVFSNFVGLVNKVFHSRVVVASSKIYYLTYKLSIISSPRYQYSTNKVKSVGYYEIIANNLSIDAI